MSQNRYMEDLLVEFLVCNSIHNFVGNSTDHRVIASFCSLITAKEPLTQSQGSLAIKLLKKYQTISKNYNLNFDQEILSPQWKLPFRVLDLTKKIFVRTEADNQNFVCLKFPFSLKDDFVKTFGTKHTVHDVSLWDHEEKIRKIRIIDVNIIHLYDWGTVNGFEFDENFLKLVSITESVWQSEDKILPHSVIFENTVILLNSTPDADNFFTENATGEIFNDMLLAKSMNFPLKNLKPKNSIEKIATTNNNIFWMKNYFDFFELYKKVSGKICLILDRASARDVWLKNFIQQSNNFDIPMGQIKVCFRESNEGKTNFNQWVKDSGLGGSVENGKLLIFEDKPAKWLFRDNIDVKIIVTNNLFANSTPWVNDWMMGHPCVIYLGEHKPTLPKVKDIAIL